MDSFVKLSGGYNGEIEDSIHILTHNLQSVNRLQKKNGEFNKEEKTAFISKMKAQGLPNVICTQETTYKGFTLLKESLEYPHAIKSQGHQATILSKNPILNNGELDLRSDEASSAIWADIKFEKDTFRIYSIHLKSNKISEPASEMLEDADLQSSKTWNSVRGILANYKNSTTIRVKQANIITKHAKESPYKTIFCGDLNDTPLSNVYYVLATDKKDSFKECGSGIGTTYAGVIPALRIDYILADDRLDIIDHQIHKGNYSDHYAISAKIVLP